MSAVTDEEKKRVLQMIFSEIVLITPPTGLMIEFKAKAIWEPYVEAVLAAQRRERIPLADCYYF